MKRELEIQRQSGDHQELQLRDAHSQLTSAERRVQELSDKLTEYEFYKNKQDLVEKEHVIQVRVVLGHGVGFSWPHLRVYVGH